MGSKKLSNDHKRRTDNKRLMRYFNSEVGKEELAEIIRGLLRKDILEDRGVARRFLYQMAIEAEGPDPLYYAICIPEEHENFLKMLSEISSATLMRTTFPLAKEDADLTPIPNA